MQQEIQNLREQMAQLQYQLDIRVTALVGYQSTLEVIEEPVEEAAVEEEAEEQEEEIAAPTKKEVRSSWSDMREARWRAEKEAQELRAELERERSSKRKPEPEEPRYEAVEDDSLVEGRHLSAVERKIQALEQKLAGYEQESATTRIEREIKSEYPDFDSVVSSKNLEILKQDFPEVARTIFAGTDLKDKSKAAYLFMKKMGIAKEVNVQASADKVQALKNSVKPKPASSISPTKSSPLNTVYNLTRDTEITDDLQDQLMRMNEAAMRR